MQGKHTCPCQQGSHLCPLRANGCLFIQDVFPQLPGGPWQRCCCSPAPRVVFHPGRRQSRRAQEGHFKEFYTKAVHNRAAGAGRRQGARPARSRSSSLSTPSLKAAASPGHRRWKLPLLPPLSKGLCAVERCLGSGSEQPKSPIRHRIASYKRYQ